MSHCDVCNYKLRTAIVINSHKPNSETIILRLKMKFGYLDFRPGQFILISKYGFGEIAIGLASTPKNKEFFEICIRKVGTVSRAFESVGVGEEIELRGPYGNGYPMLALKKKDVLLVAGGVGIAPLRSLIQINDKNPDYFRSFQIIYGAKSAEKILFQEELITRKGGFVTVEEPAFFWDGLVGKIPPVIEKIRITSQMAGIICGPEEMYRSVTKKLLAIGLKKENIYLMLERRMKCGIGKCQHCSVGDKYVCLDGPVFSLKELENNMEALC